MSTLQNMLLDNIIKIDYYVDIDRDVNVDSTNMVLDNVIEIDYYADIDRWVDVD